MRFLLVFDIVRANNSAAPAGFLDRPPWFDAHLEKPLKSVVGLYVKSYFALGGKHDFNPYSPIRTHIPALEFLFDCAA